MNTPSNADDLAGRRVGAFARYEKQRVWGMSGAPLEGCKHGNKG
ncbi:MAG: hypothetical protein V4695_06935 [Pseudomonadota bacterium]